MSGKSFQISRGGARARGAIRQEQPSPSTKGHCAGPVLVAVVVAVGFAYGFATVHGAAGEQSPGKAINTSVFRNAAFRCWVLRDA